MTYSQVPFNDIESKMPKVMLRKLLGQTLDVVSTGPDDLDQGPAALTLNNILRASKKPRPVQQEWGGEEW